MYLLPISNNTNTRPSFGGKIVITPLLQKFKKNISVAELSCFNKCHKELRAIKDGKEYTLKFEKVYKNLDGQSKIAEVMKSVIRDEKGSEVASSFISPPKELTKIFTRENDPLRQIDYGKVMETFVKLFRKNSLPSTRYWDLIKQMENLRNVTIK